MKNAIGADLLKQCKDLELLLSDQESNNAEIDGLDLFTELKTLMNIISANTNLLEVLRIVKCICKQVKKNETLPNFYVILRILLTVSVTVASANFYGS